MIFKSNVSNNTSAAYLTGSTLSDIIFADFLFNWYACAEYLSDNKFGLNISECSVGFLPI